mmetsp:Transcript_20555/g.52220  ORF Transcript_20555/g.52220 Transcript_20555/m.52220 type:complete len:220 (-) Transcript_20555:961-1620(-)
MMTLSACLRGSTIGIAIIMYSTQASVAAVAKSAISKFVNGSSPWLMSRAWVIKLEEVAKIAKVPLISSTKDRGISSWFLSSPFFRDHSSITGIKMAILQVLLTPMFSTMAGANKRSKAMVVVLGEPMSLKKIQFATPVDSTAAATIPRMATDNTTLFENPLQAWVLFSTPVRSKISVAPTITLSGGYCCTSSTNVDMTTAQVTYEWPLNLATEFRIHMT